METNFNEKESLRIINEMISQAQNNFRVGAANPGIFCGYVVAFTAVLQFILLHVLVNPYLSNHVWWLMIPMSIISRYIGSKNSRESFVVTPVERIIGAVWSAFLISVILFLIIIFSYAFLLKTSMIFALITTILLLMTGMAQFITAKAVRLKAYLYGSLVYWAGSLACIGTYVLNCGEYQFLILAFCSIFGLAIPGHILNRKATK